MVLPNLTLTGQTTLIEHIPLHLDDSRLLYYGFLYNVHIPILLDPCGVVVVEPLYAVTTHTIL